MASETSGTKRGRGPGHPVEFKRQLAALASVGDVSVSKIALTHGINVNMLFRWRRQYRAGLLEAVPTAAVKFLPVHMVTDLPESAIDRPRERDSSNPVIGNSASACGFIQITLAHASVRIEGAADAATVQAVLLALRA